MDTITAATMKSLVDHNGAWSVSVYLPTHRKGPEIQQDHILLRNLLDRARDELTEAGMRKHAAEDLLRDARKLIEDGNFWSYQDEGLAIFITPQRTATHRLPRSFEPFVSVADAFHVKPLWPIVGGQFFYILALSRNEVRLWRSDLYELGEVELPDNVPRSLAEALWFDDTEKQLQHHAAARAGGTGGVALFHGHGGAEPPNQAKLDVYLRAIDRAVRKLLDPDARLVVAGTIEIASRYRNLSGHPALVNNLVSGNPDHLPIEALHQRALDVVEPVLLAAARSEEQEFLEAGTRAVSTLEEAVPAAVAGRVATLFIPGDVQVWGHLEAGRVQVHDDRAVGDRDLLDVAGAAAWSAGGKVYVRSPEEIPGGGPVAATLRF